MAVPRHARSRLGHRRRRVGAEAASLALLPLIQPDVIKLDLRLVQDRPDEAAARLVGAITAHAERTGSLVLAEGIETEAHRDVALACGASLGQGWLFARPEPLPHDFPPATSSPIRIHHREAPVATRVTAAAGRTFRSSTKRLLIEMSKLLEQQAAEQGEPATVLGAFQRAERFTAATARRYAALAGRSPLVGAIGIGLTAEPAPGVRGRSIRQDDPLSQEWTVAVVSPHFATALIARDLVDRPEDVHDEDRRFEFLVTYDHDLVLQVAMALTSRIVPLP